MNTLTTDIRHRDNKQLAVLFALILGLCFVFWTQARFPALDEKTQMGSRAELVGLGFEELTTRDPHAPYLERVLATSINWLYSNWQGMTFGLLLGALFLSVFSLLNLKRPIEGRFAHLWGSLYGAPLAVCANCATPVAMGVSQHQRSLRLSLAMISSSPTLNIFVLTLALNFLPIELVLTQILLVAIYLLIVLPSVVKSDTLVPITGEMTAVKVQEVDQGITSGWSMAFKAALILLGTKLKLIGMLAIPLMLVAGVLGALVFETSVLDSVLAWSVSIESLLVLSALALFLPVPIAFDLIIVITLHQWGLASAYLTVLWFCLGVFSVFPALTFAKVMGLTRMITLIICLIVLGAMGGAASGKWIERKQISQQAALEHAFQGLADENLSSLEVSIDTAFKVCASLSNSYQANCLLNWLADQSELNEKGCLVAGEYDYLKQICLAEVRYQHYVQETSAKESGNCEALGPELTGRCELDRMIKKALKTNKVEECLGLTPDLAAVCTDQVIALHFESYGGNAICDDLNGQNRYQCQGQFALQKAVKTYHLPSCKTLGSAELAAHCEGSIAIQQLEGGAGMPFCEQLTLEFSRTVCRDYARLVETRAARRDRAVMDSKNILTSCSPFLNTPFHEICQLNLADHVLALRDTNQLLAWSERASESEPKLRSAALTIENVGTWLSTNSLWLEHGLNIQSLTALYHPAQVGPPSDSGRDFDRVDAEGIGLHIEPDLSPIKIFEPFSYGAAIASADINGDAWPDLVVINQRSAKVFLNKGGHFSLVQTIQYPYRPISLALVDLNQDQVPELVTGHQLGLIRVVKGTNQGFVLDGAYELQLPKRGVVISLSFSDPNKDGQLDMALGLWTSGNRGHFSPHQSHNHWLVNQTKDINSFQFEPIELSGVPGETLSVQFFDFDLDGVDELMEGNDADVPDQIYEFNNGVWDTLAAEESYLSKSSLNTMSFAAGDINNDGYLDLFSTDMSFGSDEGLNYCDAVSEGDQIPCLAFIEQMEDINQIRIEQCSQSEQRDRVECLAATAISLAYRTRDTRSCKAIPEALFEYISLCDLAAQGAQARVSLNPAQHIPSDQFNQLHIFEPSTATYTERAKTFGVSESYWSWHSQFVDVNNDGWQDLFVGNGYEYGSKSSHLHSNVLFTNVAGKHFEKTTKQSGLIDYKNTSSFVWIDYDRDGDRDLISLASLAGIQVWRNNTTELSHESARFVSVKLQDLDKQSHCVGCQVWIESELGTQTRKINLSGGFWSFSPLDLHFGMGESDASVDMHIRWSDGTEHVLKGMPTDRFYRIERKEE